MKDRTTIDRIVREMHEACHRVAQNSCADAVESLTMSVDELADALGIELPEPESYDEDDGERDACDRCGESFNATESGHEDFCVHCSPDEDCSRCGETAQTLSSDGLCDGCVEQAGHDRESYSDDQDRESYTTDGDA